MSKRRPDYLNARSHANKRTSKSGRKNESSSFSFDGIKSVMMNIHTNFITISGTLAVTGGIPEPVVTCTVDKRLHVS